MKARLAIGMLMLMLVCGCADIKLEPKPAAQSSSSAQPAATTDARPIADIRRENEQLRAKQAQLEKENQSWQQAVWQEEAKKKQLNQEKDRLEHDLKAGKKQAKKD